MSIQPLPRTLGPYLLVEEVGEGGMGIVFRALDSQGENVALKLVRPDIANEGEVRRRFIREARAAARLIHPNIVRLLDFSSEGDEPFMVMEYVGGGSLVPWRTAPPDGETVRSVFIAVLEALAYAHARGVVHRDLKPENVLLHATADGRPDPRVLDFGVAHLREDALPDGSSGFVGTPEYMSPEHVLNPADISPASDLYSIGIMLYEVMCGRLPFSKASAEATAVAQVNAPLPPVVIREGYRVTGGLEKVIARLLAKHAFDRYLCAVDVIDALRRCQIEGTPANSVPRPAGPNGADERTAMSTVRTRRASSGDVPVVEPGSVGLVALREPPFIGREAELRRMAGWVAECITSRRSRVIGVHGDAGTGKTRLVSELVATVEQTGSMQVWRARAGTDPQAADGVLRQAFRYGLHLHGLSQAQCEQRIEQWLVRQRVEDPWEERALLEYLGPEQSSLNLVGAEQARWALLERTLKRASVARPVLLWIDNAHAVDGEVFRFVKWMRESRGPHGGTWCILLSGRMVTTGSQERWIDLLQRDGEDNLFTLDVERLADATIAQMLRGQLSILQQVATQVAGLSQGNPQVSIELVRYLLDHGFLQNTNDEQVVTRQLPDAIRTVVDARIGEALSQIGEEELLGWSLQLLAASGVPTAFSELLDALERLEFQSVAPRLDRALTAAVECGLIREDKAGVFHFGSGVFMDAVCQLTPASREPDLHRALALSRMAFPVAENFDHVWRVGHHFERAQMPEAALERYNRAVELAQTRQSHDRALRAWTSILDLSKGRPETGFTLAYARALRGGARTLLELNRLDEASRMARAIRGVSNESEGDVQRLLALIAFRKGDLRSARERFERASELMIGSNPRSVASLGLEIARLELLDGQVQEAERRLLESREEFHQLNDKRGEASSLHGLAQTASRMGLLEEAANYVTMAAGLYREIDDRRGTAECNQVKGDIELLRGNARVAAVLFEAARQAAGVIGEVTLRLDASLGLGRAREAAGDAPSARTLYQQTLEGYRQLGVRTGETITLMALAHLDASEGLWDDAEARFNELLNRDDNQRIDDPNMVWIMIASAKRALAGGRITSGRQLLEAAEHKLARMGAHTFLADQVDEVHYLLHEAQRVRSSAQSYRADTPVDDGE
jgi:tetratricopeptide (TPR) repeat protein